MASVVETTRFSGGELAGEAEQFASLLNAMPGMAYRCRNEPRWPMEYVSRGCQPLTGYTQEELLSGEPSHFGDLIHPDDRSRVWEEVQEAIQNRQPFELVYRLRAKSGDTRIVWECGECDRDAEGHAVTLHGLISDYTEEARHRKAVQRVLRQTEELATLRSAIFSNLSHEVRTPLTIILGFARHITDAPPDAQREFRDAIEKSALELLHTMDVLLEIANLETSASSVSLTAVDVVERAQQAANAYGREASRKGLHMTVEVPAEPVVATADVSALDRVLQVLLSNAVKFTENGEVGLKVQREPHQVKLEVADTGRGISEEFRPLLYEAFAQESAGLTRQFGGTGLGLALAKRLVERMEGEITVRSEKGKGSAFCVYLSRWDHRG